MSMPFHIMQDKVEAAYSLEADRRKHDFDVSKFLGYQVYMVQPRSKDDRIMPFKEWLEMFEPEVRQMKADVEADLETKYAKFQDWWMKGWEVKPSGSI